VIWLEANIIRAGARARAKAGGRGGGNQVGQYGKPYVNLCCAKGIECPPLPLNHPGFVYGA